MSNTYEASLDIDARTLIHRSRAMGIEAAASSVPNMPLQPPGLAVVVLSCRYLGCPAIATLTPCGAVMVMPVQPGPVDVPAGSQLRGRVTYVGPLVCSNFHAFETMPEISEILFEWKTKLVRRPHADYAVWMLDRPPMKTTEE